MHVFVKKTDGYRSAKRIHVNESQLKDGSVTSLASLFLLTSETNRRQAFTLRLLNQASQKDGSDLVEGSTKFSLFSCLNSSL